MKVKRYKASSAVMSAAAENRRETYYRGPMSRARDIYVGSYYMVHALSLCCPLDDEEKSQLLFFHFFFFSRVRVTISLGG